MTAPRIHLLESPIALKEGTDQVPMCELGELNPVKVPKAYFIMSYEAGIVTKAEVPINTMAFCRKCTKKLHFRPAIEDQRTVYLYYAIAGQESRNDGISEV